MVQEKNTVQQRKETEKGNRGECEGGKGVVTAEEENNVKWEDEREVK